MLPLSTNKNAFWLTRIIIIFLEDSLAITVKCKALPSQEAESSVVAYNNLLREVWASKVFIG